MFLFGFNCYKFSIGDWVPDPLDPMLTDTSTLWSLVDYSATFFAQKTDLYIVGSGQLAHSYKTFDMVDIAPTGLFKKQGDSSQGCDNGQIYAFDYGDTKQESYPVGYGAHVFRMDFPTVGFAGSAALLNYLD